jgi:hypothetical protein
MLLAFRLELIRLAALAAREAPLGQPFKHALERTRKGINVVSYDASQHQLPNVLKAQQMNAALVTENLPRCTSTRLSVD